jgi:hypothetical protein
MLLAEEDGMKTWMQGQHSGLGENPAPKPWFGSRKQFTTTLSARIEWPQQEKCYFTKK